MGENSNIEWTDHTFNPWIGCQKVSPGCKHCYAEAFARRYNKAQWGPTAQRVRTSAANWRKPIIWNQKAADAGTRARVFCASLADVFEMNPQLDDWRDELLDLIKQTPHLDWLLLTKRPAFVNEMVPAEWRTVGRWPINVWIGTSVEDQTLANERIPDLLNIPAPIKFLSCEPLVGPVKLPAVWVNSVSWVIVGGESGPHARPMAPEWAQSLRDQCIVANVAFFFKQWGEWAPKPDYYRLPEWTGTDMIRMGKMRAGRQLDGQEWNEAPELQVR